MVYILRGWFPTSRGEDYVERIVRIDSLPFDEPEEPHVETKKQEFLRDWEEYGLLFSRIDAILYGGSGSITGKG